VVVVAWVMAAPDWRSRATWLRHLIGGSQGHRAAPNVLVGRALVAQTPAKMLLNQALSTIPFPAPPTGPGQGDPNAVGFVRKIVTTRRQG
jgi:hypothetical protein